MKKIKVLIIAISILFAMSACSQQENREEMPSEKPNVTDSENKETPEKLEETQYENNSFKEVVITETESQIVITGKARVFEGVFQYALVTENETLIQDHYQTDGAPAWGEFKLTFEKNLVTKEGTSLELFVYSAKDGSKTDILKIPLNEK
jgi:hypothetical protein